MALGSWPSRASGGGNVPDPTVADAGKIVAVNSGGSAIVLQSFLANGTTAFTQAPGDTSTKVATTGYTDTAVSNAIAGINPAVAVTAATIGPLPSCSYSNGSLGIGATLTSTTLSVLTVDGHLGVDGERYLVKDQVAAVQNGMFVLTQGVVGVSAWVLTRASDYNQPSNINNTGAIPVVTGNVNIKTTWVLTSQVVDIGIDPLTFDNYSLNPSTIVPTSRQVIAGTGMSGGGSLASDVTLTNAGVLTVNGASGAVTGIAASGANTDITSANNMTSAASLGAVGTILSGTWQGSALTSPYLPAATSYTNVANAWTASQSPSTAGAVNLGSTLLPWGSLYVGGSATNNNRIVSAVTTAARTFTLPDADSNSVVPSSAGSHQFATGVSSIGVISYAAPDATDISGLAASATTDTTNASNISSGTLPAGRLPNPSSSALGGIQSKVAVTSNWINSISTAGVPSASQPAFTDISGSVAAAQLPNPSASTLGGVQSKATVTSNFLTGISTSGVPSAAQPAFSDISGTATNAQLPTSGVSAGSYTTSSITVNAQGIVTAASSGAGSSLPQGFTGNLPTRRQISGQVIGLNGGFTSMGGGFNIVGLGTAAASLFNTVNNLLVEKHSTSAVNNNQSGIHWSDSDASIVPEPTYYMTATIVTGPSIANTRIWVAITSGSATMPTTSLSGSSLYGSGFFYDTSLGHTTWQFTTSDAGADNSQNTGVTVAINTTYTFYWTGNTTTATGYINGGSAITSNAHQPVAGSSLSFQAFIQTLTTAVKTLYIGRHYCEN